MNIVQQIHSKLIESGFTEEDAEKLITASGWRYLGGRSIITALIDGDEDKVFEALDAMSSGAYL